MDLEESNPKVNTISSYTNRRTLNRFLFICKECDLLKEWYFYVSEKCLKGIS